MSYHLSTDKLQNPVIKEILEKISAYFKEENIQFYIIGATARDIILSLHNEKAKRATRDLDIAIAISDWSKYADVEKGILKIGGFTKDPQQKQRFLYNRTFQVDFIPFGDIKKQDDKIYWPPDESIAMTSLGFAEAQRNTYSVKIDDDFTIDVASLAGIFILKLFAWTDRNLTNNSDADDMGFIINNYLSIHENRAIADHYDEIYLEEEFEINIAGAKLLGMDIASILKSNPATKDKLIKLLKEELNKAEESRLINQILETNVWFNYGTVFLCIKNLVNILEKA